MNDLSKLIPVKPDQGKAQWVEGKITGIAKDEATRTHLVGIPPLMPCTIIFVHGVNSEGEWYRDAAAQFAEGLKKRLGRDDLEGLEKEKDDEVPSRRFKRVKNMSAGRYHSPILPFYWGYKVPPKGRPRAASSSSTRPAPIAPMRGATALPTCCARTAPGAAARSRTAPRACCSSGSSRASGRTSARST